jgi:hypothetical protein
MYHSNVHIIMICRKNNLLKVVYRSLNITNRNFEVVVYWSLNVNMNFEVVVYCSLNITMNFEVVFSVTLNITMTT